MSRCHAVPLPHPLAEPERNLGDETGGERANTNESSLRVLLLMLIDDSHSDNRSNCPAPCL